MTQEEWQRNWHIFSWARGLLRRMPCVATRLRCDKEWHGAAKDRGPLGYSDLYYVRERVLRISNFEGTSHRAWVIEFTELPLDHILEGRWDDDEEGNLGL